VQAGETIDHWPASRLMNALTPTPAMQAEVAALFSPEMQERTRLMARRIVFSVAANRISVDDIETWIVWAFFQQPGEVDAQFQARRRGACEGLFAGINDVHQRRPCP
jgi:hypothetical protein